MGQPSTSRSKPWQKTACILCECNCGIEVQLDGRHLIRFRGDKAHPASQGYACEKPHRLDHYQNGPDRLLQPMRKRADGTHEPIDWDTAIREVAERLAALRDEHGGESIFYYGGGGQGNHLPGAYSVATRRALGSRYRSSALAQEKTGEFWVSHRMVGTQTRGDFEHCQVGMFLGKNPWFSHGIARARVTLKELSRDPQRTMIVVDPRRTKTAELADIHLQVNPGTDAWLLAAIVAVLLEEGLTDSAFLEERATGFDAVVATLGPVDVSAYAAICGVGEALIRRAARVIGEAESFASYEDLGVQMNRHSTLVSYLHRLIWLLTGNFGRKGTHYSPTPLQPIADGSHKRDSPVTGARIVGGLVPCNSIADEILTDHEKRFRAMIVEAANPAHSLADTPRMHEALLALDTLVVIDVAMTETAKLADYVLPATTQFEKAEATFFNFEFPKNYFHLRRALLEPAEGPLPEAEIHTRLTEALGALDDDVVAMLTTAAKEGLRPYATALMKVAMDPRKAPYAPAYLYRTLGPELPEGQAEGAVLLALAAKAAMTSPAALARAGFEGSPLEVAVRLFETMLESPSGFVFSEEPWEVVLGRVGTPDEKIHLALDDLLDEVRGLADGPGPLDAEYPFVLSAGERRAFTANTIVRDSAWRKKDAEGALRMSPADAEALGIGDGDAVRLTTRRGSVVVRVSVTDVMRAGHVSLPNGLGLDTATDEMGGVAPNLLTETAMRDPFVGTPQHKFVPARIEALA